jgi:AcrR family transcriptional regulator
MRRKRYGRVFYAASEQEARVVASTLKRGGRPKAGEAEQRNERLVRTAGEMFMQFGFDGTSMEAVARAARISKRTLYGRYVDKAALFSEVVRDLVRRWLVPIAQIESEQDKLDDVLLALARYLTTFSLTPESVSVNRVVIFESQRRPEIGQLAEDAGRKPAVAAIASILSRRGSELRLTDYELAADQFLNLTVGSSLRLANLGVKLTPDEIDRRVHASVDLFLSGARRCDLAKTPGRTANSGE